MLFLHTVGFLKSCFISVLCIYLLNSMQICTSLTLINTCHFKQMPQSWVTLSWWVTGYHGNCGSGSLDWPWYWSPDGSKMADSGKMAAELTAWCPDLVTLNTLWKTTWPPLCRVCFSSVRLCYTSNHNQTGQAIIYPKAWAVPTSEKDQSSPGTQVSHCSRGQKLVACQLWFVTTYVSRLLPRQRASFNISVGSWHKHLTLSLDWQPGLNKRYVLCVEISFLICFIKWDPW